MGAQSRRPSGTDLRMIVQRLLLVYHNLFPFLLGRQQDYVYQAPLHLGVTMCVLASEMWTVVMYVVF